MSKEIDEHTIKEEEYLDLLKKEIQEFEQEKEKIRRVMGDLGGTKYSSKDLIVNVVFGVLVVGLLVAQLFFQTFDSLLSIELAVFLVSIKIILMMSAQHKHNHFMFWVLNTIEYRINDTYKLIKKVEKLLIENQKQQKKIDLILNRKGDCPH